MTEWTVDPAAVAAARSGPADPLPLSYNQELHLKSAQAAARAGLPGNPWIGATFDIAGAADLDALGSAFTSWMRRHEALRSGFRERGELIERFTVPAEAVVLDRGGVQDFGDAQALHTHLDQRFVHGVNPLAWPGLVLGVIVRPDRSTVFLGMDHVAGDGFSLALAVWELQASYESVRDGGLLDLPETGSFADACVQERAFGDAIRPDDPALAQWRDFVRACGGTTPAFPLPLGVEVGQTWPQRMHTHRLLTKETVEAVETACQEAGGSIFAGLLSAMAIAVGEMTGQQQFRTIIPLHTRHQKSWRTAMGWFITCAPVDFSIEDARGFADVLPRAQASVRAALRLSRYPAARMIQLLGDDFRVTRRDLFSMVSYTDYRKMPGADRYAESTPRTIGQVSVADDSHVWASRLDDGLHLAIRHPDTPVATDVLDHYVSHIAEVLGRVAVAGEYPMAPTTACLATAAVG
ncbi:condensation domain-containing protein [Terrabacter sp. 2YAF2]|uniref:condensation domain-containing protein n=1 Tax=Terrabacter sp. 2YAF2 TaxID=3233026 RepID=UPI003F9B8CD0